MVSLFENYFQDGKTAYVFSADHGMNDRGNCSHFPVLLIEKEKEKEKEREKEKETDTETKRKRKRKKEKPPMEYRGSWRWRSSEYGNSDCCLGSRSSWS